MLQLLSDFCDHFALVKFILSCVGSFVLHSLTVVNHVCPISVHDTAQESVLGAALELYVRENFAIACSLRIKVKQNFAFGVHSDLKISFPLVSVSSSRMCVKKLDL